MPVGREQYVADASTRTSYWGWDGLWTPLVTSAETHGSFSILEQTLRKQAGPPPHIHDQNDEVFFLLEGEVRLQVGDEVLDGEAGQLIRIPPGTPHGFVITSDSARFLNLYVPGALDLMISSLSTPAPENRMPSVSEQHAATEQQRTEFRDRLEELATQIWVDAPDLLADLRPHEAGDKPGGPQAR